MIRCRRYLICFLCLFFTSEGTISAAVEQNFTFDKSVLFGVATAAYQIEGSWNESGKGVNVWDYYTHDTNLVSDGSTGDIACDSYNQYKEDVQLLKKLGVDVYRFSFSWTRILPTGQVNNINQEGVDYYNNYINELIANDIKPIVTIYHWDHPRSLDLLGGWFQPNMVDYMVQYADLLFSLYGDRVKTWITLNEPHSICVVLSSYIAGLNPTYPKGTAEYMCGHNMLKAHSEIWHLYKDKYRRKQKGTLGIALSLQSYFPATDTEEDRKAVDKVLITRFGWFAHPVVYGNYPPSMIDTIARYSAEQGFPQSRLPRFTWRERSRLAGSYDFIGVNNYISFLVQSLGKEVDKTPSYENDGGATVYEDPDWNKNYTQKIQIYATGFRKILTWVKKNYKNPKIFITEQGYANQNSSLNDEDRIYYFQTVLPVLWKAINEDKVKIAGYTVWTLMDDFEWVSGYKPKMGLYRVDFDDPKRTRTPRDSLGFMTDFYRQRSLAGLL
ncbi:unnamed protein product [Phaedon cochleariae]|uniref:Myrosinase 1-like n=1 Tax=Phaedon cochleariae TaxID=80249 RepID=A0A9P0GVE7_PHACE|nr:unnamed protein product [Phaedon cochleariae]